MDNSNLSIISTNGYAILVSKEDYPILSKYKWSVRLDGNRKYAHTIVGGKVKQMHRIIIGDSCSGLDVDHKDGNGLNNTRENLRVATRSENMCNMGIPKNNKSGYKGVHWSELHKKWHARITKNGKLMHIGFFDDIIQAAKAYNAAAKHFHGEFARPNPL